MVLPHTEKIADSEAPAIHLAIERLSQKVRREAYRMNGFVRFAKMENDLFLAVINPRFDVLPLVRRYFEKRHADQRWVIFDSVRSYGLYFDMQETLEVRPDSGLLSLGADVCNAHDEACRRLWKTNFNAANISERRNPKLHLRQQPRRYWQYLPEKNLD